jgi:hypothetical protein
LQAESVKIRAIASTATVHFIRYSFTIDSPYARDSRYESVTAVQEFGSLFPRTPCLLDEELEGFNSATLIFSPEPAKQMDEGKQHRCEGKRVYRNERGEHLVPFTPNFGSRLLARED